MVHEPRFTAELLASLLSIPPSKTLLRRHLSTHFKELLGRDCIQEKREAEATLGYVPLSATAKVKVSTVHYMCSLQADIAIKLVEAAGKGVTGCRIMRQNLQVRIAVFVAWGQCELGFQAGKWESVERNNGGCSKGIRELKRLYSEAADITKKGLFFDEPALLCELSIYNKEVNYTLNYN
jgi:hypothetical protein